MMQLTVVVADDDQEIRELLAETLSDVGYAILTADNGRQATALVRANQCQSLIVDLVMPEQKGLDTIREVRQFRPDLHIIAMSGSAVDVRMATHLGADIALLKPFTREQLLTALRRRPRRFRPTGD
jgi:DNA-binding response OmpR family regulator